MGRKLVTSAKQLWIPTLGVFIAILLIAIFIAISRNRLPVERPVFGVTFSSIYAENLGLDAREVYTAMLDDLDVKYLRLPAYWSRIETSRDEYDWHELDWFIEEAEKRGVGVTLAIGQKVPRWPECFIPDWVEHADPTYRSDQLIEYLSHIVHRYKDSSAIIRWQIENEPFLPFGECPKPSLDQFQREVDLVRSIDSRPIQLTASGELDPWVDLALPADILGISMYRETWNDYLGFFYYPINPGFYTNKARAIRPLVDKVLISELQAEPWFPESIDNRSPQEWYEVFNEEDFEDNVEFAIRTKLDEVYLWGIEWWYFLKTHQEDRLWEYAKEVFRM